MPTRDYFSYLDQEFDKLQMTSTSDNGITFVICETGGKKRKSYVMPNVKKVTHTKDGATVVFYDDGTKSWVRPAEGTEPDPFVGFCMAVMKRLYGSTTNMIKDYEEHLTGGGANGCKKGKNDE